MSSIKPITKLTNNLFGVLEFDDKYLIGGAYYNKNLNQMSLLDIGDIPYVAFSNRHQLKPFNSENFIINVGNVSSTLANNLNQFLSHDTSYKFQSGILIDNNTKYMFTIPFSNRFIFIKDINGSIRTEYSNPSFDASYGHMTSLLMKTNTPNRYLVYTASDVGGSYKTLNVYNSVNKTLTNILSFSSFTDKLQVLKVIDNRVILAHDSGSTIQIRQLDTNTNTFTNITSITVGTGESYISKPITVSNFEMYYIFYIQNNQLYYRTITADYSQSNLSRIFTIGDPVLINNITIQSSYKTAFVPVITRLSDSMLFVSLFIVNLMPYFRHRYTTDYDILNDGDTFLQQTKHVYTFSISSNYGLTYAYDFTVAPDTITGIDVINENGNMIFITTKMGGYLLNLSQDGWSIVSNINKSLTSYMRDSLNRMWMVDFEGNLYMSTVGLPYRIVVKPEKTSYNYVSGEILTYVDIDAYDIYNNRVAIEGKLVIKSANAIFIDGSKEKDIQTSTTGSTRVSFKVTGGGLLSISFIPRYRVNNNG